ncbi:pyrroline-5-carboxylate reductase [Listeria fleischmannii]|uniref:pyrroline-5-carboxylate reductase n=1 Tax=Listeria fleischmannii TaxID=1069827 RepID=UPI0016245588|nr:pyrroline-5-carboxylate reductase [Listeria fleischmannii]MBC1418707.1 pyrroline-5-carboxylate reductase [Listeria fleischmannii]
MKIGFIGVGNMSSAIIRGLVKETDAADIFIYNRTVTKAEALAKETGVMVKQTAAELIRAVDIVVLAVKPYVFELILPDLKEVLSEHKPLVVSIAAGLDLRTLASLAGSDLKIMRVMPNVNATIGESMTGVCGNELTTTEDEKAVETIFSAVGEVAFIEEKNFSAFTAIAGSSPAFIYIFIDALARAGVKAGLQRKEALRVASQAVVGSSKMILESERHPYDLVDQVCSPGGTTIAGVSSLMDDAFVAAVMHSVSATIAREKELSQE